MSDEQVFIVRARPHPAIPHRVGAGDVEYALKAEGSWLHDTITVTEAPPLPPLPADERWVVEEWNVGAAAWLESFEGGTQREAECYELGYCTADRGETETRVRKLGADE